MSGSDPPPISRGGFDLSSLKEKHGDVWPVDDPRGRTVSGSEMQGVWAMAMGAMLRVQVKRASEMEGGAASARESPECYKFGCVANACISRCSR